MFQVLVVICIYTIWAFLDYVNLYLIYDKYLTINRRKKKKVIYLWFILMIIIGVSYGLINSDIIHSGFLIFAVFIPYYFKILPVLWTIFPRRYKDVPIVFLYQLLVATVSQGIYVFFDNKYEYIVYKGFIYDLCELITVIAITGLLLLGLFLRKNNIFKLYFGNLTLFQYVLFCIALFTADFIEAGIMLKYPYDLVFKISSMINIVIVCLLMSQLTLVNESDVRKGRVIDILDEQMNKVTGYYNEIIDVDIQCKKFRHDIKNLLMVLYSLVETGENDTALEYIEKMNVLCTNTSNKFETGNFVANTLLSAKKTAAEKINTDIQFQGHIPAEIENVDLVILLSNILDNALDACEQIEGTKTVLIDSILQKNIWILVVKNPTKKDVKIKCNRIETTKSNKQLHGFGIQNMERVAKKYNGALKFEYKEGQFTTKALLQI